MSLRQLFVSPVTSVRRMMASNDGAGALQKANLSKDPKAVSPQEWQKILDPETYHVTRESGTEPPFSGKFDKHKEKGVYNCVCCGAPLFDSTSKFNSGCGWPAFDKALAAQEGKDETDSNVLRLPDESHGMKRVEVKCKKCDAHLGHVFEDGPRDTTGERFCINSVCMTFDPAKDASSK